jgi:hypothetical protein
LRLAQLAVTYSCKLHSFAFDLCVTIIGFA